MIKPNEYCVTLGWVTKGGVVLSHHYQVGVAFIGLDLKSWVEELDSVVTVKLDVNLLPAVVREVIM